MAVIARLVTDVSARTKGFTTGMNRARRALRGFGRSVRRVSGMALRFGALLGGAVAGGGLVALGVSAVRSADQLGKVSTKLGISAEALQKLQLAAELSGVSVQNFNLGLQRMVRRAAEVSIGTGEAKAALDEMGLSAEKLSKMPLPERFRTLIGALEKVTNKADRLRLSFKLFDSEGAQIGTNLADLGVNGLGVVAKQAERLGLVTSAQVLIFERLNDSISRIRFALRSMAATVIEKALPSVTKLLNVMTGLVVMVREGNVEWFKSIAAFGAFIGKIVLGLLIIPKIITGMSQIVKAVKAVTVAFGFLQASTGVGIVTLVIGLGVATFAARQVSREFDAMTRTLGTAFEGAEKLGKEINKSFTGAVGTVGGVPGVATAAAVSPAIATVSDTKADMIITELRGMRQDITTVGAL